VEKTDSYVVTTFSGPGLPKQFRNMIYSKWLKSLRHGNDMFKLIDPKSYYSYHHLLIDDLLGRPTCAVRLAALSDNPDVVLGFSVCRLGAVNVIDYVYVNRDVRKLGIGTSLLPPTTVPEAVYTHVTKTGLTIAKEHCPLWTYNPYV
jgi:hypothetical protein